MKQGDWNYRLTKWLLVVGLLATVLGILRTFVTFTIIAGLSYLDKRSPAQVAWEITDRLDPHRNILL